MVKAGIKEIRDRFTYYLKLVKKGEEIIIEKHGEPLAVLKPLKEKEDMSIEEKLERLQDRKMIQLPKKSGHLSPHWEKLAQYETGEGKSLTDIVLEEREKGW
ncbi:MAG: type II toxin-antitoxin system prevent-host-death family antitoxin [Nitrospinae bacterium]|nr:type II toxin-antitoxin system prevent-host-death family antitoxin [Nitrospinota bacterium]